MSITGSLLIMMLIIGVFLLGYILAGVWFSFRLTGRSYLQETSSPAEAHLPFDRITLYTKDGLQLKGWYIPAGGSKRTVILLHGHGGSMDPDIHHASYLHKAGYNVLMFDFRAHGRSPGRICSFGFLESRDALAAIDYVLAKGAQWIALMGFSMGGMTAIATAPRTDALNAVVVDGSPARFKTMLKAWGEEHHLPGWLATSLPIIVVLISSLRIGANLFQQEPVRWIGKINPTPIMLIHGEEDQYCPDFEDMVHEVGKAEIWREPGVGHVQLSIERPDVYRRKVMGFLKAHW